MRRNDYHTYNSTVSIDFEMKNNSEISKLYLNFAVFHGDVCIAKQNEGSYLSSAFTMFLYVRPAIL